MDRSIETEARDIMRRHHVEHPLSALGQADDVFDALRIATVGHRFEAHIPAEDGHQPDAELLAEADRLDAAWSLALAWQRDHADALRSFEAVWQEALVARLERAGHDAVAMAVEDGDWSRLGF